MKEVVLDVPKKLEKVIRKHVKYLKKWFPENDRLLLNSRYEPMSSVSLTKFLQSLFYTYFRKRIGSSQIRAVFLSHKYSHEADQERKKVAREMLHSVETQKFYIKKGSE